MVYTVSHRSLAVLEMLIHVRKERLSLDAMLIPLDIPDNLIDGIPELPEGWNLYPHHPASRRIGDEWIAGGNSLAMFVPSAMIPAERNILINPNHVQFSQIRIGEPEPHAFDKRLFNLR